MKFTGSRTELANAAKWVSRAIPRNPPVPILAGMVLEATDGGLRLSAFDYDLALTATVEGVTEALGRALVPGPTLAAFLSAARGKDAELAVEDDLTVRSGSASSVLRTLNLDDYPDLPAAGSGVSLGEMSAEVLADVVQRFSGLPLKDAQPVWQQAAWLLSDGEVLSVTIGSRYAVGQQVFPLALQPFEMVLPAAQFNDALGDLEGGAGLYQDSGSLGIITPTRAVSLRQFEARFPEKMNDVIHRSPYNSTVTVDRDSLSAALKLTSGASDRVQVAVDSAEMTLTSYKPEKGEAKSEITDVIPCECDEPGSFITAHRYLQPILTAMTGSEVRIRFGTGASARGATATDGRSHFAFMPTRGL
jgi:DNA polymerase-3 subunit beta